MKGIRFVTILSVVCITTVFALAKPSNLSQQSCPFKENINYKVINTDISETVKITELFSVYCATCYLWEKGILEQIKEKINPSEVVFEQAHSSIAGQFAKQISTILAIAKLNNHYEATKKSLFSIVQLERKKWATEQDFFKTMETIGFSYEFYKKHEMNLQVIQSLMEWNEISNLTDIIPSLIINNKYLILTHKLKNIDELERMIMYLLELSKN